MRGEGAIDLFAIYLSCLEGSWRAIAAAHPDADVRRDDHVLSAHFPRFPVLDNAAVLDPAGLKTGYAFVHRTPHAALWSRDDATAAALERAGFRESERTTPMVCDLRRTSIAPSGLPEVRRVVSEDIASLNGFDATLLLGVPGLRCYATASGESGLAVIITGTDANVSCVSTRPDARRRGLALAVTRHALREAQEDGLRAACLQATAMAAPLYAQVGFVPVGTWREWIRPGAQDALDIRTVRASTAPGRRSFSP